MSVLPVVAIDESSQGHRALTWLLVSKLAYEDVHLLHVLPPAPFSALPLAGGLAAGAALAALASEAESSQANVQVHAQRLLGAAKDLAFAQVPPSSVHAHVLPAAGGASGVAQSLIEYVHALEDSTMSALAARPPTSPGGGSSPPQTPPSAASSSPASAAAAEAVPDSPLPQPPPSTHGEPDAAPSVPPLYAPSSPPGAALGGGAAAGRGATGPVEAAAERVGSDGGAGGCSVAVRPVLVCGSRGMGGLARSLMGLVGLGSVSDYAAHHAHCPVLIVRGDAHVLDATQATGVRRVVVAWDDASASQAALSWAVGALRLHAPASTTHLHCVTVAWPAAIQVLDEAATVAAIEAAKYREEMEQNTAMAQQALARSLKTAECLGVGVSRVSGAVVQPEGASDIGAAVVKYAQACSADLLVCGSRGMGGLARSLMGLVGLGSVSDYAAHHAHCPVAIIKEGAAPVASGDHSD